MISDLMLFARPPKLIRTPCRLEPIVQQVVAQHRAAAAEREIELTCILENESLTELSLDETQIAVAVDALITNAIEAVGVAGTVRVVIRSSAVGDDRFAEIVVLDDGPGISPDVRRHMFDPFYSGREAGRGLGFGLSKCWRIVTDHGGDVIVEQSTGRGAEFTIRLPLDGARPN